jgi:hypothetical protein
MQNYYFNFSVLFGFIFIISVTLIPINIVNAQESVNQNSNSESIDDQIFEFAEEMPRFPGCEKIDVKIDKAVCAYKKMITQIKEKLKYPKAAKNELIEGKVIVRVVITKDSLLTKPVVLEDIGGGCGEEVVRVLKSMNDIKWIPGKHNGKPVSVSINIPVEFKLTDRWKEKIRLQNPADIDTLKERVFYETDEMPRFPGCESIVSEVEKSNCSTKKFISYINSNLVYPEELLNRDVNDKIIVKFIIQKNGFISNIEILKDMEGGFGAEVKRIITNLNKQGVRWIPGKNKGKPENVFIILPVYFRTKAKAEFEKK